MKRESMKKLAAACAAIAMAVSAAQVCAADAASSGDLPAIIPAPQKMTATGGSVALAANAMPKF